MDLLCKFVALKAAVFSTHINPFFPKSNEEVACYLERIIFSVTIRLITFIAT